MPSVLTKTETKSLEGKSLEEIFKYFNVKMPEEIEFYLILHSKYKKAIGTKKGVVYNDYADENFGYVVRKDKIISEHGKIKEFKIRKVTEKEVIPEKKVVPKKKVKK